MLETGQEMKEALEERKRDAQLEKDARARVLAQIAADREERKRRLERAPKVEEVKTVGKSVLVGLEPSLLVAALENKTIISRL